MREPDNPFSSKIRLFDERIKRGDNLEESEIKRYAFMLILSLLSTLPEPCSVVSQFYVCGLFCTVLFCQTVFVSFLLSIALLVAWFSLQLLYSKSLGPVVLVPLCFVL